MKIQMERVIDHNLRFNTSFKSMEHMVKTINSNPNAAIKLPTTKCRIKKNWIRFLSMSFTLNVQSAIITQLV